MPRQMGVGIKEKRKDTHLVKFSAGVDKWFIFVNKSCAYFLVVVIIVLFIENIMANIQGKENSV
jgi:hypothetical protein